MRARALLLLLLAGSAAWAKPAPRPVRTGSRRCQDRSRRECGGAAPLLQVLPGGPASSQTALGTLTGSKGEPSTTARASTRSCTRSDGVIVTLSANQPCVESTGLLVEPSGTNLALKSEQIGTTTFQFYGGASAVQNSTDVLDVYGTGNTAEKVSFSAISGTGQDTGLYQQISTVSSGAGAYSLSVFARTASGSASEYLYMQDGTNLKGSTLCTFGTSYSRCCLPNVTMAASATSFFHLGVERAVAGGFSAAMANQPAATLYVQGFQVEKGATCSSYIPTTTTAVTRAGDVVSMAGIAGGSSICLGVTGTLLGLPNDAMLLQPYQVAGTLRTQLYVRASDSKVRCDNGSTQGVTSTGTITLGTSFHASCSYDGTNYTVCLNGGCTSAAGTALTTTTHSSINLGNHLLAANASPVGWLHSFYFDSKASPCP